MPGVLAPRLPATRSNATISVAGSCTKLNRSSNRRAVSRLHPVGRAMGQPPGGTGIRYRARICNRLVRTWSPPSTTAGASLPADYGT